MAVSQLNPQNEEMYIGVRTLRKVTVYPLSLADQLKMTDVIIEAVHQCSLMDKDNLKDADIVGAMLGVIKSNLGVFLECIFDPEDAVTFEDITNEQFSDLVMLVFSMNYESSIKKFQTLTQRVKGLIGGKVIQKKKRLKK